MPVYQTGPDRSIDDVMAAIDSRGEEVVQVIARQGRDSFLVFTKSAPPNDTGRPWAPDRLLGRTTTVHGEQEVRSHVDLSDAQ